MRNRRQGDGRERVIFYGLGRACWDAGPCVCERSVPSLSLMIAVDVGGGVSLRGRKGERGSKVGQARVFCNFS